MKHCTFHPIIEAKRECLDCLINVCDECSDDSASSQNNTRPKSCFICFSTLQNLTNDNEISPFWRNLGQLYRYPFALSSIAVILVCALLASFLPHIFSLIPIIAIIYYCFSCLRFTANGDLKAPDFENCFTGSVALFFYLIILFFVLSLVIGGATVFLGEGFGTLTSIFCMTVLPAGIIVLVIDEKLLPAMNPAKLISIVTITGSSYFIAVLFLLIMTGSIAALNVLTGSENSFSNRFLQNSIINYYSVIMFHILGYVVYQNSHQLGFGGNSKSDQGHEQRNSESKLNSNIEILIKAGHYKRALELAAKQVKSNDATLIQWKRCMQLLLIEGSNGSVENFTDLYFEKLESLQRHEDVAEAYLIIKQRNPEFSINKPERQLTVSDSLLNIGKPKYVIHILKNFHKISKDRSQVCRGFDLLSQAYTKIPGQEKNASLCRSHSDSLSKT